MSAPKVVVVGGGFAGFFASRTLERALPADAADLTIISATDHLCYSPLLPEVASGRLDPRRIAISLHSSLKRHRILQGTVDSVDLEQQTVTVRCGTEEPTVAAWDRLILTVGSVTKTFPTPGLTEHALGLKTLVEAQYIHDHVLRQLEMAAVTSDVEERRARLTFTVVGAGYAGTETAAQLQRMTHQQVKLFPSLSAADLRWVLLDLATAVLPELGPTLGKAALKTIRARGMDVRLGTSVTEMSDGAVTLSDGSKLATHTVLWTVGVTPPPLVSRLELPVDHGRLLVDNRLVLRPNVWAGGDAAAAKDPYNRKGLDYPPTAQHAQRMGVVLGRNVAASLGHGTPVPYRHHDLGLVADLGGTAAVARPLGIPLTGVVAKLVTKGYHLYAIPAMANRLRVGVDWVVNAFSPPVAAQLGLVSASAARLDSAEHTRA